MIGIPTDKPPIVFARIGIPIGICDTMITSPKPRIIANDTRCVHPHHDVSNPIIDLGPTRPAENVVKEYRSLTA
jgi:hypothetical protein